MPNQPPLDLPALANLRLLADEGTRELRHVVLEPDLLHKLLDVAEERATAEAEAQAKLEAEALELHQLFESLQSDDETIWLAVARRAREINKEEK